MTETNKFPKRGEIWLLKNDNRIKEISKDYRPVLIISNNTQNKLDRSIVAFTLTSDEIENVKSFEVYIKNSPKTGLDKPSKILCNYPFTIDKELRLEERKLGTVDQEIMEKVRKA